MADPCSALGNDVPVASTSSIPSNPTSASFGSCVCSTYSDRRSASSHTPALAMPPHETQGSGTSPMQCRPSKVTTIRQPGDGARGIAADDVFRRRVSSYRPPLRRSYVAVLACLDSYCRAPRHNCSSRTAVLAMRRSRIRRSRRPAGQIYFCTRLLRLHQQFGDSFCVAALRRYHGTAQRSPAAAPSLSSSGC